MRDIKQMPVMPDRCKTCPFNDDGCIEVRNAVIAQTVRGINQTCHTTGTIHDRPDTHLCAGAREFQRQYFHALGVLDEPTEEAWAKKLEEINGTL